MTGVDVAVVGGGLAGVHAAYLLQRAGVDFELIEARDRLGGRILSAGVDGTPADDGFDLGPSWFWPETQPALAGLVETMGLTAFTQHDEGDALVEWSPQLPARRMGTGTSGITSMRIAGGSARLVDALADRVPAERIRLACRVSAMTLDESGVDLTLTGSGTTVLSAGHVIAALPPRMLGATVAFTPAQDASSAARWRDTPTWMAPHAKFLALYDRPFWRNEHLSGMAQSRLGPMAEVHDATTASGRAALFGFVGMPAAQRRALGEEALAHACLDQLGRLFGPLACSPLATLFKDWSADPLTAIASDQSGTAHNVPQLGPWVRGPWQDRLALAGSETSPAEPGYLAGAIMAAERAVGATLEKIAGNARV